MGTVEYTVPVVEKVRLALFYDVGVVWQGIFEEDADSEAVGDGFLTDGWGVGVRFDIPGFPIQLDYAWPINYDSTMSDSGRFNFWIGYTY
jgi:outer membrane protein insertion porin family